MNSVVIRSIDRAATERAVAAYAARVRAENPEVEQIYWFGSWVTGMPTPGSDVDIGIVVSRSDKPRIERAPDYLPVGFPVGIDLFVYTRPEFARLMDESPSWYATIVGGREL